MIQCQECEFFQRGADGRVGFRCDPFSTVKEPECLVKWQLIKLNQMVAAYQSTLDYYRKLAPMQEKMFKVMEREIDDMNEAEKWRVDDGEEADDQEGDEQDTETFDGGEWRP